MDSKPDERDAKSTSYLQIALAMLGKDGLSVVRTMKPQPSKHSLARAVHYLLGQDHTKAADELARYIRIHWPLRKSKTRPKVGDVRIYKVHEQDDIRYARIPVEVLGAKKGDQIQTVFEEDKITLRHIKPEQLKYAEAHRAKKGARK